MSIQILNRFTSVVILNLEIDTLRGANLRGAKNAPLLITSLDWVVQIDGLGQMRIGCQNHSVEAWRNFSELEIARMADEATGFWSKHKTMLLMLCDAYKHPSE